MCKIKAQKEQQNYPVDRYHVNSENKHFHWFCAVQVGILLEN